VRDEGNGRPPTDRELAIRSAIRGWRDSLINLTGANRLLNFKPSRTGSIELVHSAAGEMFARLRSGGT
jgi:hypothetical protein